MNEYIFYTTEGYTEGPNNKAVENCQMLGIAFGASPAEALESLLNENEWIAESGFSKEKILFRRLAN